MARLVDLPSLGQQPEPALDLVDSGGRGGREVDIVAQPLELLVVYETGSLEMLAGRVLAPCEQVFRKPFDPMALAAM
jgi:hypothetical protein